MMPFLIGLWLVPGIPGAVITNAILHRGPKKDSGSLEELVAFCMVWGTIFWVVAAGIGFWKVLG